MMDRYKTTFQTWDKIASIYQDKFMDMDLYNDSYALFCQLLEKENSKILDIGCGPGNVTKFLLTQRPDFKIKGIDVAPNMVRLAKANNPAADFEIMDCRKIDQLNDRVDGIICGFCLPYLSKEDCSKLLKDSFWLLNDDGVVYFSAIEGDYSKSGYETGSTGDKAFVYYHSEDFFKKELVKNNFDLLEIIRKDYPKSNETSQTHIIFIARKI